MPALPTPFFHQPHPANDHPPVHRLAPVVDREQGHAAGGEGFHFHARLAGAFGGGLAQRILTVVFFGVLYGSPEIYALEFLRSPPGNHLEALSGDRIGQHSVRINKQWRVCFVWTAEGPADVEIVDYH